LNLIKKIISAIGKKDEPTAGQSGEKRESASTFKDGKARKTRQEEWRPGGGKTVKKKSPQERNQSSRKTGNGSASGPKPKRKPKQKQGKRKPSRQKESRPPKQEETPWNPEEFKVEPWDGKIRFHDLNLHPNLMRSIHALGWQYCTPIQGEILPGALKGRDMAGRAQTGTGKTAAFLITIINHCLNNPLPKQSAGKPRALIIAPTRELAVQIKKDADDLNRFTGLRSVVLYGGMDYNKQQRELENSIVDIVVATPGRLLDFESKGVINLQFVEQMVIDEADRMLDMGFIPDVRRIIYKTPLKGKRQTLLFSATLSDEVMQLASAWMVEPERVDIVPEQVAVDTVDQKVYIVTSEKKFTVLYNILRNDNPDRVLVFTNRRDTAEQLSDTLKKYGFNCAMLSGAVTQKRRMRMPYRSRWCYRHLNYLCV